jgi:glutathione S-transferase
MIGDKSLSSWSLRPWLLLKHLGVAFDEIVIRLKKPSSKADIVSKGSPSGRVPCLHHDGHVIWDSLAIAEYLAEIFPDKGLWPDYFPARVHARSIVNEMHSGFTSLRTQMTFAIKETRPDVVPTDETRGDIDRILTIWRETRGRFGQNGDFLFGRFTIADAFYAPVVSRFRTYCVPLDDVATAYSEAIFALPSMQEWLAGARAEDDPS